MVSLVHISREILERIFSNLTCVSDLLERNKRSAYNSGSFLSSVAKQEDEIKNSRRDGKAITRVCRRWHDVGLRFRCEYLIVDAKSPDIWQHVDNTLRKHGLGQYVKRLQFDAFDSCNARVKSSIRILRQCLSVRHLSLTFADDCRANSPIADLLIFAIRSACASTLEHLDCDFGMSFEQALLLRQLAEFPNLRSLQFQSAYEVVTLHDPLPLEMVGLRKLKLATTKDKSLGYMSEWTLPAFEDLCIHLLHSAKAGNRRFFATHGFKLRTLELTYVVEGTSALLQHCKNLEELVLSLHGLAQLKDTDYSLFHSTVKRVGIREMCSNSISARKTMVVLDRLMRKLTSSILFPNVREIRLLDFHRSLLVSLAWTGNHAELWIKWSEICDNALIVLQAADGRRLSVEHHSIRLLHTKYDYSWLSLPK